MRNTLIPILVAICLFITGVAILNIQLWYSAKAEYLAGARYAANNINHILEEASQATQTAVNIAGKECNLEEQYQLGTEAALKPHLRTIIILKQGIVDSICQCNTPFNYLFRCFELQCLSRSVV